MTELLERAIAGGTIVVLGKKSDRYDYRNIAIFLR